SGELTQRNVPIRKTAWQYGVPKIEQLPIVNEQASGDYRALEALNWSTLKRFLDDPRWFAINPDQGYEETEAMKLGTMIHCMVLESDQFCSRYSQFLPPKNEKTGEPYKSGKAYDAAKAEFEKQGKIACTEEQLITCCEVKKAITDSGFDRFFAALGTGAEAVFESVIYDPEAKLKGRIDCYNETYGLIDFKTCSTPISDSFGRDLFQYKCRQFGYVYQLAFYAKIIRDKTGVVPPCSIIAAETSAPYRCGLYELSNNTIEDAINTIEMDFLPRWYDYKNGERVANQYLATL
nr:PD-(D/E)XK nuclease-like domain-containing protein [Thermoguttaceae bacterium]